MHKIHFSLFAFLLGLLSPGAYALTFSDVVAKTFYDTSTIHFHLPVLFMPSPMTDGAFIEGDLSGALRTLRPTATGFEVVPFDSIPTIWADGNDGLLGLAFHPDFKRNRKYYVYYIRTPGEALLTERLASPSLMAYSGMAERVLLRVVTKEYVHNGGDMHFGPDGYLYLGLGDAGNPNVYNDRSQDMHLLQGKMLRLDVDHQDGARPYAIPRDNPFVSSTDTLLRKEIFALGLRQPWRWSFTSEGRLVVADVGDWVQEEIDIVEKGNNYGWSRREGNTCFNKENEFLPLASCDTTGLTAPKAVLPHSPVMSGSISCIIGGYVFEGDAQSPFNGKYIFSDYVTRKIFAVSLSGGQESIPMPIGLAPEAISAFGEDKQGNIYVVGYTKGIIYRLEHPDLIGKELGIKPRASYRKSATEKGFAEFRHGNPQLLRKLGLMGLLSVDGRWRN